MSSREEIIDRIVKLANTKYPDSEIFLYGSRARGNAKTLSDWDLLVLLNSPNIPFNMETTLMDEFYELELETGAIISPLIYYKTDWNRNHSITPLYENIKKEGVKIK
jgi:predicted nucleotidyltransferase